MLHDLPTFSAGVFRHLARRLALCFPPLRRLVSQRDALVSQLEKAERDLRSLAAGTEPDLRAPDFVAALTRAVQPTRMFISAEQDAEQNRTIGDFRLYIRGSVDPARNLLEIGPSFGPILPKSAGYRTCVLDHLDRTGLVAKYGGGDLDLGKIEEVDVIWTGGPLSAALGERRFAAIVASHVVEHAPDFVQFLAECAALLEPGGRVFLIVPDQRYCFDLLKPPSDLAKILADHDRGSSRHSRETLSRMIDEVMVHDEGADRIAWSVGRSPQTLRLHFLDFEGLLRKAGVDAAGEAYVDAHANYFTPSSFAMLCCATRLLGLQPLRPVLVTRPRGCEFLVVLEHGGGVRPKEHEAGWKERTLLLHNQLHEQVEKLRLLEPALRAMPGETAAD